MAFSLFNRNFKNKVIEELITDFANTSSNYYIGFGRFNPWDDETLPPEANTSIQTSSIEVNKDLLFGKKVNFSDLAYVTKRIEWTANTVYDYYSHLDPNLFNKDFYILNTSNRLYKCLFNNYGATSTVEPINTSPIGDFDTADGYKWKYMGAITSADLNKFSTDDYIPIVQDTTVRSYAESGAIHTCIVDNGGSGYISSNGQILQQIDGFTYKISNVSSSSINGAYNLSTFYLGGLPSLTASRIGSYVCNSSGRYVTTDTEIVSNTSSTYYICPYVNIDGNGTGAFALSYVSNTTGSIQTVEVLSRGSGYNYSTVSVVANTFFGTGSSITPIISPTGGHGYDSVSELGSDTIGLSLVTQPSDELFSWITYRQVSLLFNPTAASNNDVFTDSTFSQVTKLSINNFYEVMPENEQIVGNISGATARVAYMDTAKIYVVDVVGSFRLFETVTGSYSGISYTVTQIESPQIIPYSGEIFYYKNIMPINRTGISSEQVKIYFQF